MEQALVFASIILGVAVAFELENLHRLLRSKLVKWHWAQPLFAIFVLLTIVSYWWGLAAQVDGRITIRAFLPIMFALIMLVLLAAVSLPEKADEKAVDLADYYQQQRRYQWFLMALYAWSINLVWFYNVTQEVNNVGDFLRTVAGDLFGGAIMIVMIFVRRWWQVALGMAILSIGPLLWLGRSLG